MRWPVWRLKRTQCHQTHACMAPHAWHGTLKGSRLAPIIPSVFAQAQRVHVAIRQILKAQRGSHISILGPKYTLYTHMDLLGSYVTRVSVHICLQVIPPAPPSGPQRNILILGVITIVITIMIILITIIVKQEYNS